jgi:hypothetical protein
METFDEFSRKHDEAKQNAVRLKEETKPEWDMLQHFTAQFAHDEKRFGGYKFQWMPDYPARLVLNDVAVQFIVGRERNGVLEGCRVYFDRRPAEPGKMFLEGRDEIPEPKIWKLEPVVEKGEFLWREPEESFALSSAKLADKIALELSQRHIEYEKRFGRAS